MATYEDLKRINEQIKELDEMRFAIIKELSGLYIGRLEFEDEDRYILLRFVTEAKAEEYMRCKAETEDAVDYEYYRVDRKKYDLICDLSKLEDAEFYARVLLNSISIDKKAVEVHDFIHKVNSERQRIVDILHTNSPNDDIDFIRFGEIPSFIECDY